MNIRSKKKLSINKKYKICQNFGTYTKFNNFCAENDKNEGY
jgi:hypothetical protein